MLNVVLVEPEIPANTGNIGRTCVVSGSRLHLIEPLGFSLEDKMLKRSGMAYWQSLDVHVHKNWNAFLEAEGLTEPAASAKLHFLTKKSKKTYVEGAYADGDYLIFGKESVGLEESLLAHYADRCERIPMLTDSDALNNADTWDNGEKRSHTPLLTQDICGNFIDPEDYRISALNLSNAAAIVIYEALRQIGFPNMDA